MLEKIKDPHFRGDDISIIIDVETNGQYIRSWYTPHEDENGEILGILGLAINISDQKKAESELISYQENLEKLVEERTKELTGKNKELDKAVKVFVGRELKIRKLEDRIRALEGRN